MKKCIALFLILTLCLCGCSDVDVMFSKNPYKEEIILPTIPTQVSNLPTISQNSEETDTEDTQEEVPSGTVAPWETEFDEAGYTVIKDEFGEGVAYCWNKGYKNGRQVVYYNDGRIEDTYYYPSGAWSHCCSWGSDGSYSEVRWLDNGEVNIMPDGTKVSGMGTLCYSKTIRTDGSYEEMHYYPNGNLSKQITEDPSAEAYCELEFYENGMQNYAKYQTPSEEREERYDEEGFMTYLHTKQADYELEILTDDSGKVVKVIENGQTLEDPAALDQFAVGYNFRD